MVRVEGSNGKRGWERKEGERYWEGNRRMPRNFGVSANFSDQ